LAGEEKRSAELDNLAEILANLISTCKVYPDGEVWENKLLVKKIDGLSVHIYSGEHPPPHFHVKCSGMEASYCLKSCDLLKGTLGNKKDKIVRYFFKDHKDKLVDIWNNNRPGDCSVGLVTGPVTIK
jgi:Domain of unknown function (DUF4160)